MKNLIFAITTILFCASACTKTRDSYCASCIGEIGGVIQNHRVQCSDLKSTTDNFAADFIKDATLKGQSSTCSKYIVEDKY